MDMHCLDHGEASGTRHVYFATRARRSEHAFIAVCARVDVLQLACAVTG